MPRPARALAGLGRVRGRAVPRRAVLRPGAAWRRAAGARRRRQRRRPGAGDVDVPGPRPADGGPTRPGRRPSTPCGRPAGATRSWPIGGARRRSGRWSSRTPACSATTPCTCTWSSGVAQRLLARFRAQGFVHHDLSRACLAQARDSIPPRRSARSPLPLRTPGRAAARGDRPAGGALGGAGAAERPAQGLCPRSRDAHPPVAGAVAGRPPGLDAARGHPGQAVGDRPSRRRGAAAAARAAGRGDRRVGNPPAEGSEASGRPAIWT